MNDVNIIIIITKKNSLGQPDLAAQLSRSPIQWTH